MTERRKERNKERKEKEKEEEKERILNRVEEENLLQSVKYKYKKLKLVKPKTIFCFF